MKVVVYANSYQLLVEYVLKMRNTDISVISYNKNLIRCCNLMKIEVLVINELKLSTFIFNKNKIQSLINRMLKFSEDAEIIFSHLNFDVLCFIFIRSAVYNNKKIHFCPIEQVYNKIESPNFNRTYLILKLTSIILNYRYKLKTIVSYYNKTVTLSINQEYLRELKIKELIFPAIKKTISIPKKYEYSHPLIDVIFLIDEYCRIPVIKQLNIIERLSNFVTIGIKLHPNSKLKTSQKYYYFPTYYPVEFLLPKINKSVIGYSSLALRFAGQYTDLMVISILDFDNEIKDGDTQLRKKYIDICRNIRFPKNLDDLISYFKASN